MRQDFIRRWSALNEEALALQLEAGDRNATLVGFFKFLRMLVQVLLLGVGAWLVLQNELTSGGMIAASIPLGRALAPIEQSIAAWKSLVAARDARDRLSALFARLPPEPAGMRLPTPLGRLSCEQVVYAPPGQIEPVLRGVSFAVEPGTGLGIVGPSAAGKSSLCKILVGIWQPTRGSVRLDGADLFAWNADLVGRHIGYLPQDVELFAGTVAENVARLGAPDPDAVVAAAQAAGVHERILALPQGYDTEIGEAGGHLSGGQRQRIGLARALYGGPRVVVLDEPNASLDGDGEAALLRALFTAKAWGATVVIVAHQPRILRPSTSRSCCGRAPSRRSARATRCSSACAAHGRSNAEPAGRRSAPQARSATLVSGGLSHARLSTAEPLQGVGLDGRTAAPDHAQPRPFSNATGLLRELRGPVVVGLLVLVLVFAARRRLGRRGAARRRRDRPRRYQSRRQPADRCSISRAGSFVRYWCTTATWSPRARRWSCSKGSAPAPRSAGSRSGAEAGGEEARLRAERADVAEIRFDHADPGRRRSAGGGRGPGGAAELLPDAARRHSQSRGDPGRRIDQLERQIAGLQRQLVSNRRQRELIQEENDRRRRALSPGPRAQVAPPGLQREDAALLGAAGELEAQIAQAEEAIGETRLEIMDIRIQQIEEVDEQLAEVQTQRGEAEEELAAADDTLRRTEIVAPIAGTVLDLRFKTTGGVIGRASRCSTWYRWPTS